MRVGITTVILALGLVVMLLVIPVVSPSTSANAKIVNYVGEVPVGTVTIVDAPVITVVENTRAYQAVCVGSIFCHNGGYGPSKRREYGIGVYIFQIWGCVYD